MWHVISWYFMLNFRSCAENVVDKDCPVCNIPSHVKDIQTNRQLKTTVSLCKQLSRLLHSSNDDDVNDPYIIQGKIYLL